MMNGIKRIEASFSREKAFIAYLLAGDFGIQKTIDAVFALIDAGVTLLEIGIPFSDPIADGPVIQRASARALSLKIAIRDVLKLVESIRKKSDIPLILFSYLNPILAINPHTFVQDAQNAGVDGVLVVDCPFEELAFFHEKCLQHQLAPIYVVAPSTPLTRIKTIAQHGKGFLYYACRQGTTGVRDLLPTDFAEKIQLIKAHTDLPVVAGFGISTTDAALEAVRFADGIVVGSLFVKALEEGMSLAELNNLAKSINPNR